MEVLETKNAKVEWIPELRAVFKTFHGFIYGDELKEVFNFGVDLLKKNKGHSWISDNRKHKPYRAQDREWMQAVFIPNAIEAGWTYWALIEPQSVLGKLNMKGDENLITDFGVVSRKFGDVESAFSWVELESRNAGLLD